MTTFSIRMTRPDEEEMDYFWKLFHAAQRNDARWHGSEIHEVAEELSKCSNLSRVQKLFLLRAWQVLVDDAGGFGRLMGAYDAYVHNMQDPDDDCVAWKPSLVELFGDAELLPIVLDAYAESRQRIVLLEESHAQVIHARDHYKRVASEGIRGISEAQSRTVKLPDPYEYADSKAQYAERVRKVLVDAGISLDMGE